MHKPAGCYCNSLATTCFSFGCITRKTSNESTTHRRYSSQESDTDVVDAMIALMLPPEEWTFGRLLDWHIYHVYRYRAKIHPALKQDYSPAKCWSGVYEDLKSLRWKSERRKLKRWQKRLDCISGNKKEKVDV